MRACTPLRCFRPAVLVYHRVIYFPRSHFNIFFLLRRFCLSLACGAAVQGIEPIHRYMCSASLSPSHARTHARMGGRTDRRTHVHAMVVMQVDIFLKCKKKKKKDWGDDMFPLTMLDNQRLLNCTPPQPLSPPTPHAGGQSCASEEQLRTQVTAARAVGCASSSGRFIHKAHLHSG